MIELEARALEELITRVVRAELAAFVPKVALSISETARALSIGRTTAYELVAAGELPFITVGTKKVVPVVALEEWIAARTQRGIEVAA